MGFVPAVVVVVLRLAVMAPDSVAVAAVVVATH